MARIMADFLEFENYKPRSADHKGILETAAISDGKTTDNGGHHGSI